MDQRAVSRDEFPVLMNATDLQALGMSRTMAYRLLNRADVPAISIGGRRFMNRDRFFEWMDRNTNEAVDVIETLRKENAALKKIVAELDAYCKYCANLNAPCAENSSDDCEHCKADCPCKDCLNASKHVWNGCYSTEQEDQ